MESASGFMESVSVVQDTHLVSAQPVCTCSLPADRNHRRYLRAVASEQRDLPRVPSSATVVVRVGDLRYASSLDNVSRSGGFLATDQSIDPGTRFLLESPPPSALTFEAEAVGQCPHGVRFRFLQAPVDVQKFVPPSQEFQRLVAEDPEYSKSVPLAFAVAHPFYLLARTLFRLQVTGIENIPYGSRFIWTHNHSGWLSLDAPLVGYLIAMNNRVDRYSWSPDEQGPIAWMQRMTDTNLGDWGATFWNRAVIEWPVISKILRAVHGLPVTVLRKPEQLRKFRILATPAEGEEGNCKSSFTELYQLQYFHTGVARTALEAGMDYIQPAAIVGPEESFPNFGKLRALKGLLGTVLPIPLPILPIPVQWKVEFLPPIDVRLYRRDWEACETDEDRYALYSMIMSMVRQRVEQAMERMLAGRRAFRPWFLV
jgi:1-acyl-sn-glycerol-3-phosphate acyltransferase